MLQTQPMTPVGGVALHPSLHPDGGWLGGGRGETLFQYGCQCPIIMVAAARPLTCGLWFGADAAGSGGQGAVPGSG